MTKYLLICLVVCALIFQGCWHHESAVERGYNEKYIGEYTRKIAFPIGGIGTGMFCIEGTGALSNMSIRHRPNVFNEPTMFAAIHVKGYEYGTRILEGPVVQNGKNLVLLIPAVETAAHGECPGLRSIVSSHVSLLRR